jgi:hypothetical protein
MSEVVNTVVQKVFEHEWTLPTFVIPVRCRAEAVRIANKLRSLGYIVKVNNLYHINFLYITRQ